MSTATVHLETHFHFAEHRECRVLTESVLQHLPGAPETGVPRHVRSDELVYAMGDPTGEVFFLRRGRIALSAISDDGREQRLRAVEPGEKFGELCFCDVRARREQARALADSEVVALVVDDLCYRRRSAMLIYPRALADHLEVAEADT